jgi:Necrosis inducing protein (NPP1)
LQGPAPSHQLSGAIIWQANADGRQELFARSVVDDRTWSVAQAQANGGWNPWSGVTPSGGPLAAPNVVVRNQDGRLEIFSRRSVDLWNAWQTSPGVWGSAWANLGSPPGVVPTLVVVRLARGRLAAYSWTNTGLFEIAQTAPGSGWSSWKRVAGLLEPTAGHPTTLVSALDRDGQLVMLAAARGRLYVSRAVVESSIERLPESVSTEAKRFAVVFDFDTDSCYPSPAIFANGVVNPGLEEQTSGLTTNCRDISQLENSNTYYRKATVSRNGVEYSVHMYALYFMKDKWTAAAADAFGHRHDWEYALVWTTNGEVTHVSVSGHGGLSTVLKSEVAFDAASGGHAKIVYHKDGGLTHAFRFGGGDEQAENHLGKWITPAIVDWKSMSGVQASNERLRQALNAYNFDQANCAVNDYDFPHEVEKKPPPSYPPGSAWKAAATNP